MMVFQNAINNTQFSSLNIVSFTSNGTYTPPANLISALVTCVGGGGGGAGVDATGATDFGVGSAGAGGATVIKSYTRAALLPSVAVTVGTGGAAGAAGQNDGQPGGASTFLGMSAGGGAGGLSVAVGATALISGVLGGTGSGGDLNIAGGNSVQATISASCLVPSDAGSSLWSTSQTSGGPSSNNAGKLYGGGGGSTWNTQNMVAKAGNAGGDGVVIIYEYLAS